jgi:hypothetical protein
MATVGKAKEKIRQAIARAFNKQRKQQRKSFPSPSALPSRKTITTERLLTLAGLGFGFMGVIELFPLSVNVGVCAISTGLLARAVWNWEVNERWSAAQRVSVLLVAVVAFVTIFYFPLKKQYRREMMPELTFKESVALPWWRQQIIRHDLAGFKDYIAALHIDTPTDLPPFVVTNDSNGAGTPTGMPVYRGQLEIRKTEVVDRKESTMLYGEFVITKLLERSPIMRYKDINNLDMDQIFFGLRTQMSVNSYLNWSYWGVAGKRQDEFSDVFWSIRDKLGKSYTDRLVGSFLHITLDTPKEGAGQPNEPFPIQFKKKLAVADGIIESDKHNWPAIQEVLDHPGR